MKLRTATPIWPIRLTTATDAGGAQVFISSDESADDPEPEDLDIGKSVCAKYDR